MDDDHKYKHNKTHLKSYACLKEDINNNKSSAGELIQTVITTAPPNVIM